MSQRCVGQASGSCRCWTATPRAGRLPHRKGPALCLGCVMCADKRKHAGHPQSSRLHGPQRAHDLFVSDKGNGLFDGGRLQPLILALTQSEEFDVLMQQMFNLPGTLQPDRASSVPCRCEVTSLSGTCVSGTQGAARGPWTASASASLPGPRWHSSAPVAAVRPLAALAVGGMTSVLARHAAYAAIHAKDAWAAADVPCRP